MASPKYQTFSGETIERYSIVDSTVHLPPVEGGHRDWGVVVSLDLGAKVAWVKDIDSKIRMIGLDFLKLHKEDWAVHPDRHKEE